MNKIIIYSLPKTTPKERIKFNRQLYGFEDHSNKGKYKYERKGILQKKDYEKPIRGVIILKNKEKDVLKHLKAHKAKYEIYKIS